MKTMNKKKLIYILTTITLMFFALNVEAQVMQVVSYHDTTAHFTILEVSNDKIADIVVMKVKKRLNVSKTKETSQNVYWKIKPIGKGGKYDYKIKIVSEGTKHDLKVYFTTNHAAVRMKNKSLKFGLRYYVKNLKQ